MSLTNIDGLLSGIEPQIETKQPLPQDDVSRETINNDVSEELTVEPVVTEPVQASEKNASEDTPTTENKELTNVDDYGQPVDKKERVYTQEEVNQLMRDRNARGEWAKQQAAQEPIKQDETVSSADSDDWETQLKSVIKQTVNELSQEQQRAQWQQQAQREQAEFEIKFNNGVAKYSDFEEVVTGKPLTPQMLMATKGMDNPAAFIYAAAKTQSTELDRISRIGDPYVQAVELGKLEERMRRTKSSVSGAPKPINTIKGDAPEKANKPKNVDDILREEDARRFNQTKR